MYKKRCFKLLIIIFMLVLVILSEYVQYPSWLMRTIYLVLFAISTVDLVVAIRRSRKRKRDNSKP